MEKQYILRGLTLWRPWANLFLVKPVVRSPGYSMQVVGPKRVENRPKPLPSAMMGPEAGGVRLALPGDSLWLALHNGKRLDRDVLNGWGRVFWDLLPGVPGDIVALARVCQVLDLDAVGLDHPDVERLQPYVVGRYLWEVDVVLPLPDLVRCTREQGVACFQGLWRLPPRVEERVLWQVDLKRDGEALSELAVPDRSPEGGE